MLGSSLRGFGLGLAVVTVAAVGIIFAGYLDLLKPFGPHVLAAQTNAAYAVPSGTRFSDLVRDWQQRGFISNPYALRWYGRISKDAQHIKAGEYTIEEDDTPLSLLRSLVKGRTVQHAITLVEGWTFKQIRAAIAQEAKLSQTLVGLDEVQIMARLGAGGQHPEGRFFPDTYYFTRGQKDIDVLQRAHAAMRLYLAAAWPTRATGLPYDSPYDALIMASIVEKETGAAQEREAIAGVLVRRLKKNMLLQTDPTVIYGMGERYAGNIRKKDLREDTPYNTYVHKGLPPTPIANPGAAAIDAALNPTSGSALYFVAKGDGTGTHVFSDTYAQHRRAVEAYRARLRKRS
ncbi:MAG: endolytic transglycosylase MltG [Gammaproteobacteria bacterium]|nr:endolytic transglycosylase MltG [Gammaproteobacteria bacterium]